MLVSFSWTKDSFLANSKSVTRRYWKDSHADKFQAGMIVDAYDKLPYKGGQKIGSIKITKKPFQQYTGLMTELDYKREGLLFMETSSLTINGKKPRKFFDDWKNRNDLVWVLEFERQK